MLARYIKEFISICDYLKKSDCQKKKGYFVVAKVRVEELLDRNKYETALVKLKLWKALRWIDAEEGRLTKRVYDKNVDKYIACIKINIVVYETLKSVTENSVI